MDEASASEQSDLSVPNRVLSSFIAAVADDESLADIAGRLRTILLEGDIITEAALRSALFGDTEP